MKKIIFIYNANSSVFSGIVDTLHKAVSPETYQCNLCKITYGTAFMKKDWKQFIKSLPYKVIFLHKDESLKQYPKYTTFPLVLIDNNGQSSILVDTSTLNQIKKVEDLKNLITNSLKKYDEA